MLGTIHNSADMMLAAKRRHLEALSLTNLAITAKAMSDSTLLAVLILSNYETTVGNTEIR